MNLPKYDSSPILGPQGKPYDLVTPTTEQLHAYGRLYYGTHRVFVYCHAASDVKAGFGAANIAPQNIGAVIPVGAKAGASEVVVTIAAADGYAGDGAVAENELQGALFVAGHGETLVQNRIILANTAVAAGGGTCRLLLEDPICDDLTVSSSYVEILLNPYAHLAKGNYQYHPFMSVPYRNVSSGYNFWGIKKGLSWMTPGGGDTTPGDSALDRMAYFVGDGSVNFGVALAGGTDVPNQPAGYCVDVTGSGVSAMPVVMLDL